MTAPHGDAAADYQNTIELLRQQLDAALAERAKLAEQLARRDSQYSERINHQGAAVDVLNAMVNSPDDPQPVFDLIVRQAVRLCDGMVAGVFTYDGRLVRHPAWYSEDKDSIAAHNQFAAQFPMPPSRGQASGRAILDGRAVHVKDVRADPYLSDEVQRLKERTIIAVPLIRDGRAVGAMAMNRREPGGFSDSQISLLETFSRQAVIAITSSETYRALQGRTADLQETLEQQTATADVLQVVNANPSNLTPVFETMLDHAMRLCEAEFGELYRFDGDRLVPLALIGIPRPLVEYRMTDQGAPIVRPGTNPWALLHGEDIVHTSDLINTEAYREGEPSRRALVDLGGVRTSLAVALRKDGLLAGMLVIYRQQVRPFTDRQVALLQNFAAQAVIAMENARLLTEQREALERQTATAEVLQVINASPGDLSPVYDAILEKAHTLCGVTHGNLTLYEDGLVRAVAMRGSPGPVRATISEPSRPSARHQRLIHGERLVHVLDIRAEQTDPDNAWTQAALDASGADWRRTGLWIPLRRDTRVMGWIAAFRNEVRAFTEKEISLLENFAAQAVIAMENARLLTEQREALEQTTATSEILRVIAHSPTDAQPVFEAIVASAARVCEAEFSAVARLDEELLHLVAIDSTSAEETNAFYRLFPRAPTRNFAMGLAFVDAKPVHFDDLLTWTEYDSRTRSGLPQSRSFLAVPILRTGRPVGVIGCGRREVNPFTDKQIRLLTTFADQAAIAIENVRLFNELDDQNRKLSAALDQQTATAEVLQVINASRGDLAPIFDALLDNALRLCNAPFGGLYVRDGLRAVGVAVRGMPPAYAAFRRENYISLERREHPLARCMDTAQPVEIADVATDDSIYPEDRPVLMNLTGVRSILDVPLVKDGRGIGAIAIYQRTPGRFPKAQIALLENFAAQAVIAMENARLLTEQREALERQTATSEVLQVINANPGRLAPVFEAVLARALRLCQGDTGVFWIMDGNTVRAAATMGYSAIGTEFLTSPFVPGPETGIGRLEAGEDFVQIADLATGRGYLSGDPMHRMAVDIEGLHGLVAVPLRSDKGFLGAFGINRKAAGLFSQKHIDLLRSFADQVVIAMENARLLGEIQQRQNQLRVTFENMGDGVALFDETNHLAAWNRRFQDLLDVPDDVVADRPAFADYILYLAERGEYGSEATQQVQRLLTLAGQAAVFERTRPNGRVIEVRSNPVPSGGFVVIYADITERNRSEEELRAARDAAEEASRTIEIAYRDLKAAQANLIQAEKMASLGQLTAGIAHEIKNPLNFVNNFAALSVDLLDELKDTAAAGFAALDGDTKADVEDLTQTLTDNLRKIEEHGKRADGIVRSMLEHSRESSGERRAVDLNALVDEALNLAYHGARAQDQSFTVTLNRDYGAGISPLEVNPQDLTRVFLNLFSNAFYAVTKRARTGQDGVYSPMVSVATKDAGDAVEVRVRDNGTGIPADICDKLFQPFFTTKPTGEGTGLGLSITYDIITKGHGGTIAVESEEGGFSEFVVTLPRTRLV